MTRYGPVLPEPSLQVRKGLGREARVQRPQAIYDEGRSSSSQFRAVLSCENREGRYAAREVSVREYSSQRLGVEKSRPLRYTGEHSNVRTITPDKKRILVTRSRGSKYSSRSTAI